MDMNREKKDEELVSLSGSLNSRTASSLADVFLIYDYFFRSGLI